MKREMNPIELPQFLKECENIFFYLWFFYEAYLVQFYMYFSNGLKIHLYFFI